MQIDVIKIGGNVIDDPQALQAFLQQFAAQPGPKVLVHGGGKVATRMSERLGIAPQLVEGRRITDAATLEVVTMVYAGLINKQIAASLQALGVNALGVCGADANLLRSRKRGGTAIDYGFVGDVEEVDGQMLAGLLAQGLTPVISPITHDGKGQLLNTNADTMAAQVAMGLQAAGHEVSLLFCFEKAGVLRDVQDPESLIEDISVAEYDRLKADGSIAGGMLPKLHNAFEAARAGVRCVYVGLAEQLLRDIPRGTAIHP